MFRRRVLLSRAPHVIIVLWRSAKWNTRRHGGFYYSFLLFFVFDSRTSDTRCILRGAPEHVSFYCYRSDGYRCQLGICLSITDNKRGPVLVRGAVSVVSDKHVGHYTLFVCNQRSEQTAKKSSRLKWKKKKFHLDKFKRKKIDVYRLRQKDCVRPFSITLLSVLRRVNFKHSVQ